MRLLPLQATCLSLEQTPQAVSARAGGACEAASRRDSICWLDGRLQTRQRIKGGPRAGGTTRRAGLLAWRHEGAAQLARDS